MPEIISSSKIVGVKFVKLQPFGDERGRFMETFRTEWFPERSWGIIQTNRSDSAKDVLRGLHYHRKQVDYWTVIRGTIRVGLADVRKDSDTYKAVEAINIGDDNLMGVFIPIGIAHGFLGLTDATLMYIVDNYYDGGDEFGVAWNDPDLAIDWGVDNPILSGRDQKNPYLKEIHT